MGETPNPICKGSGSSLKQDIEKAPEPVQICPPQPWLNLEVGPGLSVQTPQATHTGSFLNNVMKSNMEQQGNRRKRSKMCVNAFTSLKLKYVVFHTSTQKALGERY